MSPRPLLFPPRRQDRRPGRFRPSAPVVRAAGPAALLAPAAAALQSVGIELVPNRGNDSSARCATPSRGLIDKATAAWMRLLADAGPERFSQAFCIECDETGLALGAGGPAGLLYGLLYLAEAWDNGLECGSFAD